MEILKGKELYFYVPKVGGMSFLRKYVAEVAHKALLK